MKKMKMKRENSISFEQGCNLYLNNCRERNLREGTIKHTFFKGNVQLINNFMMALAEQQIKAAFEQSEKEVTDLHSRISQGIREPVKPCFFLL